MKPLGMKSYGSIPHLPGSRRGPGDHGVNEGVHRILCLKTRSKHDRIIVTEKLDGSCVSVAKVNNVIVPLTRAGYHANSSPHLQHRMFAKWVDERYDLFDKALRNNDRMVGEWMLQAHGSMYRLNDLWFVFDVITDKYRWPYDDASLLVDMLGLSRPHCLWDQYAPLSIPEALGLLGTHGHHGCLEEAEGCVWRLESRNKYELLAKYVRPNKVDGKYFAEGPIWNEINPKAT